MFFRLLLLFLLWLLLRRLWRTLLSPARRSTDAPARDPYPGPAQSKGSQDQPLADITQQEISDADFEEIDGSGNSSGAGE